LLHTVQARANEFWISNRTSKAINFFIVLRVKRRSHIFHFFFVNKGSLVSPMTSFEIYNSRYLGIGQQPGEWLHGRVFRPGVITLKNRADMNFRIFGVDD